MSTPEGGIRQVRGKRPPVSGRMQHGAPKGGHIRKARHPGGIVQTRTHRYSVEGFIRQALLRHRIREFHNIGAAFRVVLAVVVS